MSASLQRSELADPAGQGRLRAAARPKLEIAKPAPKEPKVAREDALRRWLNPARLGFAATAVLLIWGYQFPTGQYITPQSGVGYALGIIGGSSMLVLLLYPLRKRLRVLAFIGTTKRWFQAHMALGIVGPVLILFHSNFSLGAANSNVALACMLVVSGSGLFGRYFYARIHHGLHGRKASAAELKDFADKLRWVTTSVEFLPDLVARIESEEQAIVRHSERTVVLARPLVAGVGVLIARRRLRRYVRRSLTDGAAHGATVASHKQRLLGTAADYIDERLAATRRVVEFAAFERLFSLWHALHLPLFVMLLVAGVVHVVAVHVY